MRLKILLFFYRVRMLLLNKQRAFKLPTRSHLKFTTTKKIKQPTTRKSLFFLFPQLAHTQMRIHRKLSIFLLLPLSWIHLLDKCIDSEKRERKKEIKESMEEENILLHYNADQNTQNVFLFEGVCEWCQFHVVSFISPLTISREWKKRVSFSVLNSESLSDTNWETSTENVVLVFGILFLPYIFLHN